MASFVGTGIKKVKEFFQKMGSDVTMVGNKNGLELHKLPFKEIYRDESAKLRRVNIGNASAKDNQKTIMIIGSTGSGKSTMIDGLCNYIFGTTWEDKHRLLLIDEMEDEKENRKKGQALSQTEWVTVYTICTDSNDLPFTLNLIDTPGFGDTRGIKRDKEIVEQIRVLFSNPKEYGVDEIDAVCFIAKAPDARLTPTQRYIFDSILSIFGKDIEENILVLITFADGNAPPVLDALKAAKMPFKKTFKFNNSALFAGTTSEKGEKEADSQSDDEEDDDSFSKMFWKMGTTSFKKFFKYLPTMNTKSLTLTNEVLRQRFILQETLKYLLAKVKEGLDIMSTLKTEKKIFEKHEQAIRENKDFTYKVKKIHHEKKKCQPGHYVTYCLHCNTSCHDPCAYADDDEKRKCGSISGDNCLICPHKCHWTQHKNTGYFFVDVEVEEVKTFHEMKAKYEEADGAKIEGQAMIKRTEQEYEKTKRDVESSVLKCREILKKLNEIALKPDPLTETEYIDLLIQTENQEQKQGFKERVAELTAIKQQAGLIKDIRSNTNVLKN